MLRLVSRYLGSDVRIVDLSSARVYNPSHPERHTAMLLGNHLYLTIYYIGLSYHLLYRSILRSTASVYLTIYYIGLLSKSSLSICVIG